MRREVLLSEAAIRDLEKIFDHIARHDAPDRAIHVMDQLEKGVSSLADTPERGAHPRELLALGIREYREIFFKPCRIIYLVADKIVSVHLIADGRRDMRTLLMKRLLEA